MFLSNSHALLRFNEGPNKSSVWNVSRGQQRAKFATTLAERQLSMEQLGPGTYEDLNPHLCDNSQMLNLLS